MMDQKCLTQAKLGQFFVARIGSGWVSHLWLRFGFGKFPLKIPRFKKNFLRARKSHCLGLKVPWSKTGQHLIYYMCQGPLLH